MPTLRHAADLLRNANTHEGRLALARELSFDAAPLPLDGESSEPLGLPSGLSDVYIIKGRGALRALIFAAPSEAALRTVFTRVAAGLHGHTSHVLWSLIGSAADHSEVGISCWTPGGRTPKLIALVAQRERIVASDAEVIVALEASKHGDDLVVHTRWGEVLGREALSKRFYRVLEQRVHALADSLSCGSVDDRNDLALLYVSRLLFLSFLEAKGWLARDRAFLVHRFDACMSEGGRFHQTVLLPLFFGTLNTPLKNRSAIAKRFGSIPFLNGGLFSKSALERRNTKARFSDAAFGALFGELLSAYRFTAREGQHEWSEAAIDPEMLGRAFESLMASRERRVSGAFYTPHDIVSHLTERALVIALAHDGLSETQVRGALAAQSLTAAEKENLQHRLEHFTVLDPACGSGAFLVHVLERLADLHRLAGDDRPLSAIRRDVLARSIHGVDQNATAVWLCELRLWLSVVIESDETRMSAVPPLPNLDCSVRVGDTLSGDAFTEPPTLVGAPAALARLRARYVRASGPRKAPLRKALAREERQRALDAITREITALTAERKEALLASAASDLFGDRVKPTAAGRALTRSMRLRAAALRRERKRIADGGALDFSFPSHFGEAHNRGGFDLIIGNPPWVRLHNIPLRQRASLRARYTVYRNAAWEVGSRGGHASRGFASQIDLAALFVERSVDLASASGCIALLLPSKLWRSLAGGGVRTLLGTRVNVREVADWSEAPSSFDAAVYPSLLIASRVLTCGPTTAGVRRAATSIEWQQTASTTRLHPDDKASPWLIVPPDVRAAFDRVVARGVALADTTFGRARLGVKCGCNDAFMMNALTEAGPSASVHYRGRTGEVERQLLRPLLRGDAVEAWRIPLSPSRILWTHEAVGQPLHALPAGAARWLGPWKRQLTGRTDLHGNARWWSLFRIDGADPSGTRVVWSDFGRTPRAAVLPAGDPTVPLNSCYVITCPDATDAFALTALMNSPLAAAWLNAIAEPARGGWHRYLAWTVALLPIPRDWARARAILAPLAERALEGDEPTTRTLLDAVYRAYRIRSCDVAPLLAWCHPPARG